MKLAWLASFVFVAYLFLAALFLLLKISFLVDLLPAFLIPLYLFNSFEEMGARKTILFLLTSYSVSLIFELLGTTTGFPFGRYRYSSFLGPFIGPVPALIPLMWASLSYFCMLVTNSVIFNSLLMVLIDLTIDPRLSPHLWQWLEQGQYFGVPASNFIGWFITSAVIYLASKRIVGNVVTRTHALYFYTLFGIAESFTDALVGLTVPAIVSFILFTSSFIFVSKRMSFWKQKGALLSGLANT